jgi:hypothetical protein
MRAACATPRVHFIFLFALVLSAHIMCSYHARGNIFQKLNNVVVPHFQTYGNALSDAPLSN